MAIFSITTPKGGVGKTTITTEFSIGLAKKGKRVLTIDSDPQGNTSTLLFPSYDAFIERDNSELDTIYNCIVERKQLPIYNSKYENLDICPSHLLLSGADNVLAVARDHKEERLHAEVNKYKDKYDFIFIDCPPNVGILTINALMASDYFITVVDPGRFSFDAIKQLEDLVEGLIKAEYKKQIQFKGFVFNKKAPTEVSSKSLRTLRESFGDLVFNNVINKNTDIEKAQINGTSIFDFNPSAPAAKDLNLLINEVFNV